MASFRTAQGHHLYYELYGKPGDPVVTIINGLSMRTSHWAPYFQLLPAAGCGVLSYDMLGQGFSSKPVLGADFDDHVRMLRELHDHLGISRPYVLGISFGGVVALKYGIAYPEATGGVLPVSTFSELDPQLSGHAMNLYTGLARVGFEFYLDLLMPLNFTNGWMRENAELIGVIKRVGATTNELYGIQNLMESLSDFTSITDQLSAIHSPTLILNGEYDYLTPRHLHDIMRREVRNSRLVLVPRVCHAFTLEIPQLTTRLIAEFVHDVERGTWKGDQSVWIAADDPAAEPLLAPAQGDYLRAIPIPPPVEKPAPVKEAVAVEEPLPGETVKPEAVPRPTRTRAPAAAAAKKKTMENKKKASRKTATKRNKTGTKAPGRKPVGGVKGGG